MNKKNVINISALIESRDSSTGKHVFRVSRYTKLIVAEMKKLGYYSDILTKNYIKELVKFASLHDIGKIFIPDSILTKPDKLTEEEFEIMKRHTQLGGEIVLSLIGKGSVKWHIISLFITTKNGTARAIPWGCRERKLLFVQG